MPGTTLDLADAAELAETHTLRTQWLSGSHKQTLAGSFAGFIGHLAYDTGTLCADLHRWRAGTMTTKTGPANGAFDKITRIPPNRHSRIIRSGRSGGAHINRFRVSLVRLLVGLDHACVMFCWAVDT